MTGLHPLPNDGRFYCGPAALAAISGEHPKGRIRSLINRHRGRPDNTGVLGTSPDDMEFVLYELGIYARYELSKSTPLLTLVEFARTIEPDAIYIAGLTRHWVALSGSGYACDNKSRIPRPVEMFPGNRCRVQGFIKISPRQERL